MSMIRKFLAITAFSLCTLALAAPSQAQHRRGSAPATGGGVVRGGGGGVVRGGGGVAGGPRVVGPAYRYYRPYYYPGFAFGLGFYGYPYYSPYYYPFGYYGAYGDPYGYGGYGYGGYGYGGYVSRDEARGIGGVRIVDAPKDAQVFADGYYAGTVDDFNGVFQHLDLEAGAHRVEIREQGRTPIQFDVNIVPGENITYHAK